MKQTLVRRFGIAAMAILMVGAISGCKKKSSDDGINDDMSSNQSNNTSETTTGSGLPELDEDTLFAPATGLEIIYFDYNSFSMRPDAMAAMRRNAEKILQVPGVIIQIEGHCDERGTQEYNLALGEKRALATREALMNLGVSGDRMVTISYGEEDPADAGHNEAAWAKNRRAEFNKAL